MGINSILWRISYRTRHIEKNHFTDEQVNNDYSNYRSINTSQGSFVIGTIIPMTIKMTTFTTRTETFY